MEVSTSPDGKLNLQLDGAVVESLRRSVKIAVSFGKDHWPLE
jgi:hypothetical protein